MAFKIDNFTKEIIVDENVATSPNEKLLQQYRNGDIYDSILVVGADANAFRWVNDDL